MSKRTQKDVNQANCLFFLFTWSCYWHFAIIFKMWATQSDQTSVFSGQEGRRLSSPSSLSVPWIEAPKSSNQLASKSRVVLPMSAQQKKKKTKQNTGEGETQADVHLNKDWKKIEKNNPTKSKARLRLHPRMQWSTTWNTNSRICWECWSLSLDTLVANKRAREMTN